MSLAAVLLADFLAAGLPPALFSFDDERTLIEWQIDALVQAGVRDVEVVLGPEAERIVPLVSRDGVEPIVNPWWQTDAASGLRVGASAVPRGTTHALILRVDEPRPPALYTRLLDASLEAGTDFTRAAFEGRAGSPVVVRENALEALRNLHERGALHDLASRFASRDVPFDSDVVLLRLASEVDLHAAREGYGL